MFNISLSEGRAESVLTESYVLCLNKIHIAQKCNKQSRKQGFCKFPIKSWSEHFVGMLNWICLFCNNYHRDVGRKFFNLIQLIFYLVLEYFLAFTDSLKNRDWTRNSYNQGWGAGKFFSGSGSLLFFSSDSGSGIIFFSSCSGSCVFFKRLWLRLTF